ncbi:hypothetical protein [Clostridium estertheticum]|uniref:hypothetical protein n=1 Tax=Clostridium estertheticum TaxID=238834 RepID=UPI001C6DD737|nr:hypothetical protein [Clostridium estertheticum]MBW9154832.1 hypothetical protein [Clostridium estertheticum]WLC85814.1 hypothetical protein KTC97_08750 [Clostridium estertheticum]
MGLVNKKQSVSKQIILLHTKLYEMGLVEGYDKGYDEGSADELEKSKNKYKSSISDGLRCGSKECAKIMGEW